MKAQLPTLRLEHIAIHLMRKPPEEGTTSSKPRLAKSLAKLDPDIRFSLQEKILEAAGKGRPVQVNGVQLTKGNKNPIRAQDLLKHPGKLYEVSCLMAEDLGIQQGRRAKLDYLFVMSLGRTKQGPVLVIFTMEIEDGMRANLDDPTHELQHIKDLVMRGKAHLRKTVLLEMNDGSLEGLMQDDLVGNSDAATYFLEGFLGLQMKEPARDLTKRFHQAIRALIKTHITVPEHKIAVHDALLAELRSNHPTIDIEEFKAKHVPSQWHVGFDHEIKRRELPLGIIAKDLEHVRKQMEVRVYHLDSGVEVRIPKNVGKEAIKAGNDKEGPFVKVRGAVASVD